MIRMRSPTKRAAALAVDAVLGLVAPLIVRRRAAVPAAPRVLLIRADHIGDAAMATAVLGPLRDALRPAALDVLAGPWAAPLFERHPQVDRVIRCALPWWSAVRGASKAERATQWAALPGVVGEIRAARYDVGIDLRGDLRQIALFLALGGMPVRVSSDRTGGRRLLTHIAPHDASLHEVEKNLAIVGELGASRDGAPNFPPPADAGDQLRWLLPEEMRDNGFAVLALRGSEAKRSWSAASAAIVSDRLFEELGLESVYVGGEADVAFGDEAARLARWPVLNLAGRTSLDQLLGVLQQASVTVAVDSGPMHIAAAVGSPVVALFGPGDPQASRPWAADVRILSEGAPCGCVAARCAFADGPGRCMQSIEPAAVIEAVRDVLSRAGAPTST